MERTEDVLIVGGGPAGTSCAYELAKKGIQALICDPSHPREKPCGGGISPLAVRKFSFLKGICDEGKNPENIKMILPDGQEFVKPAPSDAFVVSRLHLDEALLNLAIKKGAKWIKQRVVDVEKKNNRWLVKTEKETHITRLLVGADGVDSLVRQKTVGKISPKNLGLTFGYYATGIEDETMTIKFVDDLLGYIWIFPRNNHASIGIGGRLDDGERLRKKLNRFIRSYCPKIKILQEYAAKVPFANDPEFFSLPCSGDDWILVGDAAGHVDPVLAEGIPYALWSGRIAAKVIQNNALNNYDNLWRRAYGNEFAERCKNKKLFYSPASLSFLVSQEDNWPLTGT
jgi:geranylgeranyl reductase family protein